MAVGSLVRGTEAEINQPKGRGGWVGQEAREQSMEEQRGGGRGSEQISLCWTCRGSSQDGCTPRVPRQAFGSPAAGGASRSYAFCFCPRAACPMSSMVTLLLGEALEVWGRGPQQGEHDVTGHRGHCLLPVPAVPAQHKVTNMGHPWPGSQSAWVCACVRSHNLGFRKTAMFQETSLSVNVSRGSLLGGDAKCQWGPSYPLVAFGQSPALLCAEWLEGWDLPGSMQLL